MLFARCLVQHLALSGHTQENAVTVLPYFQEVFVGNPDCLLALFSVPCFSVGSSETCV